MLLPSYNKRRGEEQLFVFMKMSQLSKKDFMFRDEITQRTMAGGRDERIPTVAVLYSWFALADKSR